MSLNSINTNIAAYSAQSNIGAATSSASASIARLSSGDRIVRAADDVASLSVGTSLRTGVTTLRQALNNTSQGSSLLQVADGALSQIGEILQRQKAISVQANSGTLSDLERSYLQQEFSALASQIDQIAGATSFSSVSLLDGSLAGSTTLGTKSFDSTQTTAGSTLADVIQIAAGNAANNDQITVNGVTVTFTTAAAGSANAAGKVTIGASNAETAANLAAFLNGSTDARLANLYFTSAAGDVGANWGGGALTGAYIVDAAVVTGANIAADTVANRTIAVTNPLDGLGIDRVRALGTVTGSLLLNGGSTAAAAGSAIATRQIEDNAAFVGKLGEGQIGLITGTFTAAENATFSLKVGDITYSTTVTDLVAGATVPLIFIGTDADGLTAGGQFTINVQQSVLAATDVDSQLDVDSIATQLNDALSGITFTQNRDVSTFQEGGTVLLAGSEVANLNGISANFRSDNFGSVQVESIKVEAPTGGATDAKFTVVINGETYVSVPGIGNQIRTNTAIHLQNQSDPTKVFTIVTGATTVSGLTATAMDLGTQDKANAVATALESAFGLDDAGSKLNFQVGVASSDTVGVKIQEVSSSSLYNNATLDVTTLGGAVAASAVLDNAITNINTIRAQVGALQSRLDFIAANLESSIQNQDAARGTLLDADIAAESTAYATAQVQLQAGISVLAQANQLPQNLLKLIG